MKTNNDKVCNNCLHCLTVLPIVGKKKYRCNIDDKRITLSKTACVNFIGHWEE